MEQTSFNEEQIDFDQIMEKIGNTGPFQKRFNIMFNGLLSILLAMQFFNLTISLAVPGHWCHVPGRENTNYTLEIWKQLTIPKEINAYGNLDFSKCTRFENISYSNISMRHNDMIMKCEHGWEYDHTWYDLTAPMQNNWVCDNAMVPSNTLAVGRAGEVIGSLIFGQLGDNVGRKPIFFVALVAIILGRVMSVFTSQRVSLFLIASFIGSLCSSVALMGPYIIATEIVRAKDRAYIGFVGFVSWSIGMTILPIVMWLLRDWIYFMLVTTIPCAIFFFSGPWIIESPRWLMSKGRIKQCVKELQKIAKTNKKEVSSKLEEQLNKLSNEQYNTKTYIIINLFSSLRLVKNTLIIIICSSSIETITICLIINVGVMDGNPYLQHIFQALVQLPSYLCGKWICDRFGRRWAILSGLFLGVIGCIVAIFYVHDLSNFWIIRLVCIYITFCMSISMFTINVLNMEIYPTCLRQTGASVSSIVGSLFSILSPYIISLGVSVNAWIPFGIYGVTLFLAAILSFFLPETRGIQLPESLKDAKVFGADQDFWGQTKLPNNVLRIERNA